MDMTAYQASFDKLWGYANVVRFGAPHLKDTGSITLVSGSPARRAKAGQCALASVGGAVEQFVRAVAAEIAPKRLNVVSPGLIDTPMFGPDAEQRKPMLTQATAGNLIPRPGTPEEVADGILFVVQNSFTTGTDRRRRRRLATQLNPRAVSAETKRAPTGALLNNSLSGHRWQALLKAVAH